MLRVGFVLLFLALAACKDQATQDQVSDGGSEGACPEGATPAAPLASPAVDLFLPGGPVETAIASELGWERSTVGFDPSRTGKPPYFPADPKTTLPQVRALLSVALDQPGWAMKAVDEVSRYARSECARRAGVVMEKAIEALHARNRMSPEAPEPEVEDLDLALPEEDPLVEAFRQVYETRTPWPQKPRADTWEEDEPRVRQLAERLGPETARALARVVLGMARAETWRLAAVQGWYEEGVDLMDLAGAFQTRAVTFPRARNFDYEAMGRAAISLARAVGALAAHLQANPLPENLNTLYRTPLGEIALDGRDHARTWALEAPALVVDQRGDDTYSGVIAASAMVSIPLSVLIDLSGNDVYSTKKDVNQGVGLLSFGFLVDLEGDDRYSAAQYAQGAGQFGAGVLYDGGGNDVYQARQYAQGAGQFGLGVLIDVGGSDEYRIISFGQGYAYVRSSGLLLDLEGDDLYDADDTEIVNPSPQTKEHNLSMAQGAGYGYRGNDWPDTMSGGTGLLVDLAGDDRYGCGVYGQGSGYWFGHGVLYDAAGDDVYHGVWYVQGAAAHFASGTFIDEAGNDQVTATMNMSQGAGHDGSIGVFIDGGGDDAYGLTSLSHGAGNDVGIGFFLDVSGADVYGASVHTQGRWFGQTNSANYAGTLRQGVRALGAFFDLGGEDEYRGGPEEAGNGKTWRLPGTNWAPPEHQGLGVDR